MPAGHCAILALTRLLPIAAISTTLLLAGCAGGGSSGPVTGATDAPGRDKPVKIAMLLPLAGFDETAAAAKAIKQAGEMAIFELDNPRAQLIVKDDKGTAAGAKAAAEEAIREGAEVIVGPVFAAAVEGAAPVARQAKVPLLALSNDPKIAGNGVWLVSYLVEPEVDRVVSFAASQGKKKFAALIPDNAYGHVVEPAFRRAVAKAGGTVEHLAFYPVGANGVLEPAREVFAAMARARGTDDAVDALFLPGGPDVLPNLGPLIAYAGIDTAKVKLLGTGAWESPNIGRDETFVGGWYPGPDPRGWRAFSERFAKTFGSAPPRLAVLAYDAVGIAISLADAPSDGRFSAANLTRASGFAGVDGVIHLTPDGRSTRELAVLEVQRFGSSVVDRPYAASESAEASN